MRRFIPTRRRKKEKLWLVKVRLVWGKERRERRSELWDENRRLDTREEGRERERDDLPGMPAPTSGMQKRQQTEREREREK